MIAVGTDFGWSRIAFDPTSSFGSTVTNRNHYLTDAKLVINLAGAYLSGKKVVEIDFFTDLGAGAMVINSRARPMGFVGGGMKIYSKKHWLGFKVQARNYFLTLPTPNGDDFTSDVSFMVGPTFQLPPYF